MWPLPPKKLPSRVKYLGNLIAFTTIMHVVILLCSFIGFRFGQNKKIIMKRSASYDAPLVLLPFYKKAPLSLQKAKHNASKAMVSESEIKKALKEKAIKHSSQKVKVPAKQAKTFSTQTGLSIVKKVPKKIVSKTIAVAQAPKPKPKNIPKSKQVKTVAKNKKHKQITKKKAVNTQAVMSHVVFVGRDELAELTYEHEVCKALKDTWDPPIGVSPVSACTVTFEINRAGKARHIVIDKSSEMLAYDVAVRAALARAQFSQKIVGKSCTVEFKV